MPLLQRCSEVSIMWEESREWMKFGGNPFLCFVLVTFFTGTSDGERP